MILGTGVKRGRKRERLVFVIKAGVDSAEGLEVGCKAFGVQGTLHMARKTKGQLFGADLS